MNLFKRWQAVQTDNGATVQKALAYVTREHGGIHELLVFEHLYPESGVQVIKGTVEEVETPEEAVLREVFEEAGLELLDLVGCVAVDTVHYPNDPDNDAVHERHFFHLRATHALPDAWQHVVKSTGGDHGMTFCYRWVALIQDLRLVGGMGDYLHRLTR